MNGLNCKQIGRGPALQTVACNSHCRVKADGITQTPLPSAGTVWISYTSISYVTYKHAKPSPRSKVLAFVTGKEGKRILRDFFMALGAGMDEAEKVAVGMSSCRC